MKELKVIEQTLEGLDNTASGRHWWESHMVEQLWWSAHPILKFGYENGRIIIMAY